MHGLIPILDPEDAPLELVVDQETQLGYHLLELKAPRSEPTVQWTSNSDTEGEAAGAVKEGNLEITFKLRITGADEATFRQRQIALEQKAYKQRHEGGVVRLVYPDDTYIDYFATTTTGGDRLFDNRYVHWKRTEDTLTFVCAPFGRGQEYFAAEISGAGRVLSGEIEVKSGSAPALARAELVSDADLWDVQWGLEYLNYVEGSPVELQPADLVSIAGSALTTATIEGKAEVPILRQETLTPNWAAIASTGPLANQGVFELLAWLHMPASNQGEVGVGLEYAVGDLSQATELEKLYFPPGHLRRGKVAQVPIGQVWIRDQGRGESRWEGRVLARSTEASDVLDIVGVGLKPVGERNGRVRVAPQLRRPSALLTRDEFDQSSGALNEREIAAAGSIAGPNAAGAAANLAAVGTHNWADVGNAVGAYNGDVASCAVAGQSRYLRLYKPGFSGIPEGSDITGIELLVYRWGSQGGSVILGGITIFHQPTDYSIRLLKGTEPVGANRAKDGDWNGFPAWVRYGGPDDLWDSTWTPSEIEELLGVGIGVFNAGTVYSSGAYVGACQFLVYYDDGNGQRWVTTGDAEDIVVDATGHTAQRAAVSDADIDVGGRYAIAGSTTTSDIVVGLLAQRSSMHVGASERARRAAMARYVDESNWLYFCLDTQAPSTPADERLRLVKRVAGTVTEIANEPVPSASDIWRQLYLHVDSRGRFFCWAALLEGSVPRLVFAGADSDLAAGGVLDDGKSGFYLAKTGANAATQNVDGFVAWVPPLPAVVYEGLRLEISHDAYRRETSDGGGWSQLVGLRDYLKLGPALLEGRKNRLVFVTSRNDPDTMGVGFPGERTILIYVTPRYSGVPDPA